MVRSQMDPPARPDEPDAEPLELEPEEEITQFTLSLDLANAFKDFDEATEAMNATQKALDAAFALWAPGTGRPASKDKARISLEDLGLLDRKILSCREIKPEDAMPLDYRLTRDPDGNIVRKIGA